jgi:hypothetical protein
LDQLQEKEAEDMSRHYLFVHTNAIAEIRKTLENLYKFLKKMMMMMMTTIMRIQQVGVSPIFKVELSKTNTGFIDILTLFKSSLDTYSPS